ncbi:hypothetical protein CVT26_001427 [Gymnopilus dilepis]|uniref:Uncharacterized protein n=1 Tax=Gymnopilus dilepis TaxID=231916 RepID=A0A409W7G2_9AGAR|nr:hypothetical protein CVT26_001427 [Gymnopilus dilepis]
MPTPASQEKLAAPQSLCLPAPQRNVVMVGMRMSPPLPPPFPMHQRNGAAPFLHAAAPEVRQPPHRADPAMLPPPLPCPQQAENESVLQTVISQVVSRCSELTPLCLLRMFLAH